MADIEARLAALGITLPAANPPVGVTAICPGAFQSDMNTAARDHGDAVAKSIPVKRIGVPEDMAGAAIFLASKAGDYVVGDTIAVDGGLVHGDLKTSIDA